MDDKLNLEFYISKLITKKIQGKLSVEGRKILYEWAAEKKENADLLKKLLQTPRIDYLHRQEIRQSINKEKAWLQIQTEIKANSNNRTIVRYWQVAAAVIVAFFLSQYLISTFKNSPPTSLLSVTDYKHPVLVTGDGEIFPLRDSTGTFLDPSQLKNNTSHLILNKNLKDHSSSHSGMADTIIVPKGTVYKLTLMDGTKVWLNSNSKLAFPSQFEENIRQIALKGEAFFEVAPNKLVPFVINVNGAEVKVVGTAFNINAYDDLSEIVTTVVEGKVMVSGALGEKKEPLLPNEQLSLNTLTGEVQKKTIETDIYTAWVRGRLVFENESLENLMTRLERLYDVKITISDDVDKTLKFTGDIKKYEDLSRVLDMLATTQNVHFSMDEYGVIISN